MTWDVGVAFQDTGCVPSSNIRSLYNDLVSVCVQYFRFGLVVEGNRHILIPHQPIHQAQVNAMRSKDFGHGEPFLVFKVTCMLAGSLYGLHKGRLI